MKLKDKVAIITGGSKGIGRAVSLAYAKEGAKVVIAARGLDALNETSDLIKKIGGIAIPVPTDVTKESDLENLVHTTMDTFGTVDILVNHAGGADIGYFLETTDKDFNKSVGLNLKSTYFLSQKVVKIMLSQKKRGKIINTASVAAKRATPGLLLYEIAKAGIVAFTRGLALELGKFKINVNCVCPSFIPTESALRLAQQMSNLTGMDFIETIKKHTPLGLIPAPEVIAPLYVFLASQESDYMTGQAINFSGGFEMR